jgi:hypothetical protein
LFGAWLLGILGWERCTFRHGEGELVINVILFKYFPFLFNGVDQPIIIVMFGDSKPIEDSLGDILEEGPIGDVEL